jgi:hypothetical protein
MKWRHKRLNNLLEEPHLPVTELRGEKKRGCTSEVCPYVCPAPASSSLLMWPQLALPSRWLFSSPPTHGIWLFL